MIFASHRTSRSRAELSASVGFVHRKKLGVRVLLYVVVVTDVVSMTLIVVIG